MAKLPSQISQMTETTEFALNNLKALNQNSKPRPYLGMSGVAAECMRAPWYAFRFASLGKNVLSRKAERIFSRGDWEEHRVIEDLKAIGLEVFRRDKDGNKIELFGFKEEEQEEYIAGYGHSKGHSDGRVLGVLEAPKTEHLLEIKTMSQKYFNHVKKYGVHKSKPVYYGQMQRYMKEAKLKRALFVAVCKNDETIYCERVYYDSDYSNNLAERETNIIMSDEEPLKNKGYYCNWCNHQSVCEKVESPTKTCRSCDHVDMGIDGVWMCSLQDDKELTLDEQLKACDKYKRLF